MASGYTYDVKHGNLSLKDYAFKCAGLMPGTEPKKFDPTGYDHRIDGLQTEYDEFTALSEEGQYEIYKIEMHNLKISANESCNGSRESLENYSAMIGKVIAWNAGKSLKVLRESMITEIRESIEFDCGRSYIQVKKPTFSDWQTERVNSLSKRIEFLISAKEEKRLEIENFNEMLAALNAIPDTM